INPSNAFIRKVVKDSGEAIVVLGTRRQESQARGRRMAAFSEQRVRDQLNPHTTLPNSFIYSPIEHWTNDDVWMFLMQVENPWGYDNRDLLTMYSGASADGECPLVIDTTTPSCGDSRFGCWTCTLVDQDKSMTAMVQNDAEKEWMLPLLELRNELDADNDHHLRDFRRLTGNVQLFNDAPIYGPYTQSAREVWLRKLLDAQTWIRKNGPQEVRDIELITLDELHEIRRIWVYDKHEIEDLLPTLYESSTGESFPGDRLDEGLSLGAEEMKLLRDLCSEDPLHFELLRELLDVERRYQTMARRSGLYKNLERAFRRSFYDDKDDATDRARALHTARQTAQDGKYLPTPSLQESAADAS
ncbi:MAG: DNA phosphorothioation system sulfurtransferase DndC, partial [Actinomycetota bacterium]|nr:DNA phosphorothioation system sulfurtransferase DndC [Actinomycetota bacterium]